VRSPDELDVLATFALRLFKTYDIKPSRLVFMALRDFLEDCKGISSELET